MIGFPRSQVNFPEGNDDKYELQATIMMIINISTSQVTFLEGNENNNDEPQATTIWSSQATTQYLPLLQQVIIHNSDNTVAIVELIEPKLIN